METITVDKYMDIKDSTGSYQECIENILKLSSIKYTDNTISNILNKWQPLSIETMFTQLTNLKEVISILLNK